MDRRRKPRQKNRRRLSTSVGLSINDLAVGLKAENTSLSIDDAKKKAKELIKANEVVKRASGGDRNTGFLKSVFGKLVTSKSREEQAFKVLTDYQQSLKPAPAERVPNKEFIAIMAQLKKMDSEIQELKAVKVVAPPPKPKAKRKVKKKAKRVTSPKKQQIEDAHAGLASLGYKPDEIATRLKGAPKSTKTTSEDLIRYALQDPSTKISTKDVADEVVKAKKRVSKPRKKKASVAKLAGAAAVAAGAVVAGPAVLAAGALVPEVAAALPEAAEAVMPKAAGATESGIAQSVKSEAASLATEKVGVRKEEKESAFRKYLVSKLDEVEDAVSKNKQWSTLDKIIAALAAITIVVKAIWDAGKRLWNWGKGKLVDVDEHSGLTKDQAIEKGLKEYSSIDAKTGKITMHKVSDKDVKTHEAKKAKGQKFPEKDGSAFGWDALNHLGEEAPKSKAAMLENVSSQKKERKMSRKKAATSPVIVKQKAAPPIVIQQPQKNPPMVMKLRNDESSAASLISDLFDHPVTHSSSRGM